MALVVRNIAEAVLYVDDLPEATRFYQDALGLPLTLSFADASFLQTGQDSTLILFDRAKLADRESAIPAHGSVGQGHVAFAVPAAELDEWREHLMAQGVAIEHEQSSGAICTTYIRRTNAGRAGLCSGRISNSTSHHREKRPCRS